ncbi:MAG: glycosyltransferase family 2 protein [Planctomycetota bacterium]
MSTINPRTLIAIPVYNEIATAERVLRRIRSIHPDVLVVDDGSTDGTGDLLESLKPELGFELIRHDPNEGYGKSLIDAFAAAETLGFDWVVTMDCDEQHEPESIPAFLQEIEKDEFDLVSGSRYTTEPDASDPLAAPPPERRKINKLITQEINERLGLGITDAFCGFKAHRVERIAELGLTETGYAFPMQLWVRSAAAGHRVGEIPVRLIYNDPNRTFGGGLDDAEKRLRHYRELLHHELCTARELLSERATEELVVDCGSAA